MKKAQRYIWPFILITMCFALWGFANDITNPMVKAFSKIFRMSVTEATLIQVAFYGGYFAMAVPAAMFIRKYSFKAGVLMGLGLYAVGAFLFFPSKVTGNFYPFLIAYFILTCGLSFLETSCNPYILAMGDRKTAIRRLNLAQAFNPIGSLCGMYVAMNFIQNRLDPMSSDERKLLPEDAFNAIKDHDLDVVIGPYLFIGLLIVAIFLAILLTRMPAGSDEKGQKNTLEVVRELLRNKLYRNGVIAQFFYVGTQIMCWTFILQYGTHIFMEQGMDEQAAEVLSQKFNIAAMVIFCCSRFICTWLMRYFKPGKMLATFAAIAGVLTIGVICMPDVRGLYCLVGVSAGMSLMFPTIYGIALGSLDSEATKVGAAGLIMAILGGSVLPPLQALIIDWGYINISFVLPLVCFAVVLWYGIYSQKYVR